MTRRWLITTSALALALALLAATAIGAAALATAGAAQSRTGQAKPKPPARMLVYAQEWSLYGSRATVPSGTMIVQLWDRGQDAHNLRIQRVRRGGALYGKVQRLAVTQSGKLGQTSWHLAPGHYELYCSLPGHRARGMHTTLVVR
jgi:plastocyanin